MADMVIREIVNNSSEFSLLAGEKLEIRVLNSDGSLKSTIYSAAVPAGKSLQGYLGFSGNLS